MKVCKAVAARQTPSLLPKGAGFAAANSTACNAAPAAAENMNPIQEEAEDSAKLSGNTFSFASSATSQLVLERIMAQTVSTVRPNMFDPPEFSLCYEQKNYATVDLVP